MPRRTKEEAAPLDMTGLYLRGKVYWIALVRSPIEPTLYKPLSTGTDKPALAVLIRDKVRKWREDGSQKQREWLHRAVTEPRLVKLLDLYNASHSDGLDAFGRALDAVQEEKGDGDLDKQVDVWEAKDLNTRKKLRERTRADYIRQVRYFVPQGRRFPKSKLTTQYIRDMLAALQGARHDADADVAGGTQRNYLVGLQQFVNFLLQNEVIDKNPLVTAGGRNGWAPGRHIRSVYYEFPKVRAILAEMEHNREAHAAMAMMFGSGIELGGLNDQKRMHIGETLPDGRGSIKVPGRDSSLSKGDRKDKDGKNYRSERTIFVDAWAWAILKPYVDSLRMLPRAALWSWSDDATAKPLRDCFYRAQQKAGFIEEPEKSESGKLLWGTVQPHTLHDSRHSYCVNRSLGLDGEPPRSAAFCARQLGHGSEQMVLMVYTKAGIEERVNTLQMAEALKAAAAGGAR